MAKKRPSLLQLKKYDVTQKLMVALANIESRAILFATVRSGRTVADLSSALRIPLSTVYKKVSELEELGLISESSEFRGEGGRVKVYRSRIKAVEIRIKKTEPRVDLIKNA